MIQLFGAIEAGYFHFDSFHEKSSPIALKFKSKHQATAYSRVGLHLTANPSSCFTVAVDLAWRYRYFNLVRSLNPQFQQFGTDFRVRGVNVNRSSLEAALDISGQVNDHVRLFAEGYVLWSPHALSSYAIGGFAFNW